jgi:hypothetical protein
MGDHPFIAHRAYILMIDMKGRKVRGWTDLVLRQAASRFLDEYRRKGEARDTMGLISYFGTLYHYILSCCVYWMGQKSSWAARYPFLFFFLTSTGWVKK